MSLVYPFFFFIFFNDLLWRCVFVCLALSIFSSFLLYAIHKDVNGSGVKFYLVQLGIEIVPREQMRQHNVKQRTLENVGRCKWCAPRS